MPSDVSCMALGNVPPGELRSRFLAVGLADNTVRIISLDPAVGTPRLLIVFNEIIFQDDVINSVFHLNNLD